MTLGDLPLRLKPALKVLGTGALLVFVLFAFVWAIGSHFEGEEAWEERIVRAAMEGEFPNSTWRGIAYAPLVGGNKALIEHPNWAESYNGEPIGGGIVDYISYRVDYLYSQDGLNFYRVSWILEPYGRSTVRKRLCEAVVANYGMISTKYSEPCHRGGAHQ